MDGTPLVSICCATYNHEAFIRDALDGFLVQKVDFPIEILINDDASTDRTPQILREYEQRHPNLIRVLYQEENQYSRGVRPLIQLLVPRARGKYIAVCEGDDYWIDDGKLQQQVDLLEADHGLVACFTNAIRRNYFTGVDSLDVKGLQKGRVSPDDVILAGGGLYPTGTLMFRKDAVNYQWFDELAEMYRDELLIMNLMASGNIHYTGRVTCVYRQWAGGVFSGIASDTRRMAKDKIRTLPDFDRLNELTGRVYDRAFARKISKESLYILKHGGWGGGYPYLRRLRPRDGVQLVRYEFRRLMTPTRAAVRAMSASGLLNRLLKHSPNSMSREG